MTQNKGGRRELVNIRSSYSPESAAELLRHQRKLGAALVAKKKLWHDSCRAWENATISALAKIFQPRSQTISQFKEVRRHSWRDIGSEWELKENLKGQLVVLDSLIGMLEVEVQQSQMEESPAATPLASGNRVFIVHGHDATVLNSAARFVEGLGLPVTVLREQPNRGRTIIEKFIDYSDVGFAVVLLTRDDRGGPIGEPFEKQRARPRQNVIFELGFFIGKLGRGRVCALYREGVEIPSDYSGVLFIPLDDAGAWKLSLAQEMAAAGLSVDISKPL